MKDRENNEYRMLTRRVSMGGSVSSAVQGRSREILVCLISPARQAKKASGRTGRQWVKYRKALRHIAKFEQAALRSGETPQP